MVMYAHEGANLGGKFSDCHKCQGTGMVHSQNSCEPCRRCNVGGFTDHRVDIPRPTVDDILFPTPKPA